MNENQNVEQPVVETQPEPKVLQQHEINAMVGGAKKQGFDKGYQQAKAELMAEMQAKPAEQTPISPTAILAADHEAKLRQIASEELAKQRQADEAKWRAQQEEEAGNKILNELNMKVSAAKSKFDDYDKVVHENFGNFAKTHEVLLLANSFDNAGEMLYDIGKNPQKMANIALMVRMGLGDQAYLEMKKLSDSIKVNELSANQPKPKMPLSQVNPSNVGVGKTDDKVSSNDFKGMY